MARVLIAGCGYVGNALGRKLLESGHDVWGIRRSIDQLAPGITGLSCDLADADSLRSLPAETEYVVYCAGAGAYDEASYQAAYVTGPANLVRAVHGMSAPPRRVVFVSSTGVYAQCNGEWVDESSETSPTDFTGKCMLEGERIFLESGFNASVIRFGGIYGPGRDRTIRSVRDGTVRLPAAPSFINLIHRDDCAGALAHLLFSNSPKGIYIGVDDEPVDRRVLYTWVAEQLGVPVPQVQTEEPSGRTARSNKRCRNGKLKGTGYEFAYPTFREGLFDLLSEPSG